MSPGHDDLIEAMVYMALAFKERMRREGIRQAFEGPFWVRAVQALSFSLITMAAYTFFIEVAPLAARGVRVPVGVVFVIAGFFALGLILRGLLADRARRFGGVYDGSFRILE